MLSNNDILKKPLPEPKKNIKETDEPGNERKDRAS